MTAYAFLFAFKELSFHILNGELSVKMLNDLIPWMQDGMKVLGCPLGSETCCKLVLEAIATKIEQDLAHLKELHGCINKQNWPFIVPICCQHIFYKPLQCSQYHRTSDGTSGCQLR
jgi:hypothetical protein